MEQIPGLSGVARPHRNRKPHDVHRGEARNRECPDQPTELRVLRVLARLVKKPVLAEHGERFAERGRPLGLAPVPRAPPRREVAARPRDAWQITHRRPVLPHASTNTYARTTQHSWTHT